MITREEYGWLNVYHAQGYEWIVRDKNGDTYLYGTEPEKGVCEWKTTELNSYCSFNYDGYRLFQYIKWEDEEPTRIDDLIRDYESHQVITGGNNSNKAELVKEIEEILDDIGVSDYQLGECDEDTIWTISSITFRNILSAIEKHIPVSLSERVKVTVPQYVADWIEEVKGLKRNFKLEYLFDTTEMPDDVYYWLDERYGDTDILAKAWLDGFEIDKEKLYTVELPNSQRLAKIGDTIKFCDEQEWFEKDLKTKLTQSEIESVDPVLMQIAKEVE